MKVLIAEKPSVARDIARLIGADQKKDGYLEGNGWQVTWAFGHLVGLAMPAEYGYEGFKAENLPMLIKDFKLTPTTRYNKETKKSEVEAGVAKQLKIIGTLFEGADSIVEATDAGREGELIFRYIYDYLGCKKPFERLWISSLTDSAISGGMAALKPGTDYDNLYLAAKARSESDWLVGLNATQAITIGSGIRGAALSLGRVQTPTLAMICERALAHKSFQKVFYYTIGIEAKTGAGEAFKAASEAKWDKKEEAESIFAKLQAAGNLTVKSVVTKDRVDGPPLLYDLSALQQEANRKFGLSAEGTLGIAQTLYESKFITYPRTGSRYISEDVFETISGLIGTVKGRYQAAASAMAMAGAKLSKKSVNGEKVTDHHALLPTGVNPSGLAGDAQNIYDLIVSRMLEAFGEDSIRKVTTVTLDGVGEVFLAYGSVPVQAGWKAVRSGDKEAEDEEGEGDPTLKAGQLPRMAEGNTVIFSSGAVEERQTKPKPIFTEASLLKAMETAGKDIEDEEAREAMKESGLGTPATRAAIIERLLKTGYIERKAKKLLPLDRGLAVYDLVKERKFAKPEMTGDWEKLLGGMEAGAVPYDKFMDEIRKYTGGIVEELLAGASQLDKTAIRSSGSGGETLGRCPKCKVGEIYKGAKNAYCSRYEAGCEFKIWLSIAGKKLSDSVLKLLIQKGKTGIVKKFKSKGGKDFDAALKLKEDFTVSFDFEK